MAFTALLAAVSKFARQRHILHRCQPVDDGHRDLFLSSFVNEVVEGFSESPIRSQTRKLDVVETTNCIGLGGLRPVPSAYAIVTHH